MNSLFYKSVMVKIISTRVITSHLFSCMEIDNVVRIVLTPSHIYEFCSSENWLYVHDCFNLCSCKLFPFLKKCYRFKIFVKLLFCQIYINSRYKNWIFTQGCLNNHFIHESPPYWKWFVFSRLFQGRFLHMN